MPKQDTRPSSDIINIKLYLYDKVTSKYNIFLLLFWHNPCYLCYSTYIINDYEKNSLFLYIINDFMSINA